MNGRISHPSRLNGEPGHDAYPLPPLPVPPVGLLWTYNELVSPAEVCWQIDLAQMVQEDDS